MVPRSAQPSGHPAANSNRRVQIWYAVLLIIVAILIGKLFYLQIIKHEHYRELALAGQLREYAITAERGAIRAHEGGALTPLVLNEKLYTLFADPQNVENAADASQKLAAITKAKARDYEKAITGTEGRYVVLAERLGDDAKDQIENLKLPGIGVEEVSYRTYPQGSTAAQLLGFVNNEGVGNYGVEQAYNKELAGSPGQLKAITDAEGVPLAASRDNIRVNPVAGRDIVLTVDLAMQRQAEKILKDNLKRSLSDSGSVVIMDPNTGAIKAMANYPSYNPAEYFKTKNQALFNNPAVSDPYEVGSVMKVLTAAAAIDSKSVQPGASYYDPGRWKLDNEEITNIEEIGGPGTKNVTQILDKSINTGATWLLMQMGGQTGTVNREAREKWFDYMSQHYQLGKPTGVEQGYESGGYLPQPNEGYALELTYANTSFGQAMTATPLQMAAALSSVVNGGTYYKPRLVEAVVSQDGKTEAKGPHVVREDVVSPDVGRQVVDWMEYVVSTHTFLPRFPDGYSVGGKTGTAQIANPSGGYYSGRFNGSYLGFVGGDKPQYVIAIRVNEPKIGKYAGSAAAQPLFGDLAHMLINNFNVAPKTGD